MTTPSPELAKVVAVPRALLIELLNRDGVSRFNGECGCINHSRAAELEYETGNCPHQRLRKLLDTAHGATLGEGRDYVRGINAERREDMSPSGRLRLNAEADGDMVITCIEDSGTMATVEFCNSGGKSPNTLAALRYLSHAMAADSQGRNPTAQRVAAGDSDWRIDTSAGRPILVYQDCSVIEAWAEVCQFCGKVLPDGCNTEFASESACEGYAAHPPTDEAEACLAALDAVASGHLPPVGPLSGLMMDSESAAALAKVVRSIATHPSAPSAAVEGLDNSSCIGNYEEGDARRLSASIADLRTRMAIIRRHQAVVGQPLNNNSINKEKASYGLPPTASLDDLLNSMGDDLNNRLEQYIQKAKQS